MEDILEKALEWVEQGEKVAIATVTQTWGSSPCPPGSQLVVNGDSVFFGSVSGGCVEAAVVEESQRVIASGNATELSFGVSDEAVWEVGLACGGEIRVLVEPVA